MDPLKEAEENWSGYGFTEGRKRNKTLITSISNVFFLKLYFSNAAGFVLEGKAILKDCMVSTNALCIAFFVYTFIESSPGTIYTFLSFL
jgi:hypothetical protein